MSDENTQSIFEDDQDETSAVDNSDEDNDILDEALRLYKQDKSHWDTNVYNVAKDDLEFLSDDPDAQWDEKDFNDRSKTGRATITVDYLSQFVHQVANNIRMNTPSINPVPTGSAASIEIADVFKGLIRNIEYVSAADQAYDTAATSAVKCSIGYIHIDHDFIDDGGHGDERDFHQQLMIKRVVNPFLTYPDSASMESDGRDQNHGTILEPVKVSDFKVEFPDADVSSFGDEVTNRVLEDDDEIMLGNFFIKRFEKSTIGGVGSDGSPVQREIKKTTIYRYKLSGTQVLKKSTFPGDYIPIVPFYGEEAWKEGERKIHSLIRKAKMSQQMFNLMKSAEYDLLMKQPRAPVMVPAGSIENYAEDWLNPDKSMALRYDTFDEEGRPLPAPQRLAPPSIPAGMVNASRESVDDMKASMGLYNNAVGEQGQEVSGVAINARKIQGDVATYHFGDNAVRSIAQCGRILVCAIPVIYDGERIVQIMDEENQPQATGINGAKVPGQKTSEDLSKGKYDVRVITGASFTTKRQESANFYEELIKAQPETMKLFGDLMFQNMDVAGAQEAAARMRKIIDPKLLATDDKDTTPNEQALQGQLDQAKQIIQQGMGEIQKLQQQLQNKVVPAQLKAQTEAGKQKNEMLMNLFKLMLDDRKVDIEQERTSGELALSAKDDKVSQLLAVMDAITKHQPTDQLPGQSGNTVANNGTVNPTGGIPNA